MLTDLTAFDLNPFGDRPNTDPAANPRQTVDVSLAAMTRLRTPFGVDGDTDQQGGHPAYQG